jgi:hypothetical protein
VAAEAALMAEQFKEASQLARDLVFGDHSQYLPSELYHRAMMVVLNTTETLSEGIQLSNDYLKRLSGANASVRSYRLDVLLWRSEAIVDSRDPVAGRYYEQAVTDAREVSNRASELDAALSGSSRGRALFVLGMINSDRYHKRNEPSAAAEKQKVGLQSCRQLKESISLLGPEAGRNRTAFFAFVRTARYLLLLRPKPTIQEQRQLKGDAEALFHHLVKSGAIEENSPDFQQAEKLYNWFLNYTIPGAS